MWDEDSEVGNIYFQYLGVSAAKGTRAINVEKDFLRKK